MDTYRITFDPAKMPGALHPLTSEYVETFWLPILGPTTVAMLRIFGRMYQPIAGITATPSTLVPLRPLAKSLGVGDRLGRNGALMRSLGRLGDFGIMHQTAETQFTLAPYLPNLRPAQVAKLPDHIQAIHPQPANA